MSIWKNHGADVSAFHYDAIQLLLAGYLHLRSLVFEKMFSDPGHSRCAVLPRRWKNKDFIGGSDYPLPKNRHYPLQVINGTHVYCKMPSAVVVYDSQNDLYYKKQNINDKDNEKDNEKTKDV